MDLGIMIPFCARCPVSVDNRHGKTGGEIAKSLGISLPSVQNIKKALGLVKKR